MDQVNFVHEQLMEVSTTALNELLEQDSFLHDLPRGVTLEEVNNQIALQYGRSVTVYVLRGDGEKMPVIISQTEGTVWNLKQAIKKYVMLKLKRQGKEKGRPKPISWKYIWRTYDLQFGHVILTNNGAKLTDIGIKNKSYVEFVKRQKKPYGHC